MCAPWESGRISLSPKGAVAKEVSGVNRGVASATRRNSSAFEMVLTL